MSGPYRSATLRKLAEKAPVCMSCGTQNEGQVVMAHWRSLAWGAGMGQKPHDLPAYLCDYCHDLVDRRRGEMPREDREAMWTAACARSVLWLLQEGHLLPTYLPGVKDE